MAKLKNTQYFAIDRAVWGDKFDSFVTVGHNRQIRLYEHNGNLVLEGRLHGYPVATFEAKGDNVEVFLNPCGYYTTTTRQAMVDFMTAFGVRGNVSFAKGEFSAHWSYKPDAFTNCGHRRPFAVYSTGQAVAVVPIRQLENPGVIQRN